MSSDSHGDVVPPNSADGTTGQDSANQNFQKLCLELVSQVQTAKVSAELAYGKLYMAVAAQLPEKGLDDPDFQTAYDAYASLIRDS